MAIKDINIITSLVGKGLELEYFLLKKLLNAHDVYTVGIHYCNWANSTLVRADVNIYLEVVHPLAFSLSREHWLFPNDEWWDARNDQFLSRFTKVLCKTADSYRHWCAKIGPDRCAHLGFLTRDLYRADVPRENKFLHVAGESEYKNTEAVIGAWKLTMLQNVFQRPPLTVVTRQKKYQDLCDGVSGVTCLPRVTEDELIELMNSHRFHLIPSAYEGFGHAVHEGIGCGACVITTQAPPMNEFPGIQVDWGVPVVTQMPRALAVLNQVDATGVLESVRKAVVAARYPQVIEERSAAARAALLHENELFQQRFLALVGVGVAR